eukprot:10198934-Heterocapsa_arctica.AAC.1
MAFRDTPQPGHGGDHRRCAEWPGRYLQGAGRGLGSSPYLHGLPRVLAGRDQYSGTAASKGEFGFNVLLARSGFPMAAPASAGDPAAQGLDFRHWRAR